MMNTNNEPNKREEYYFHTEGFTVGYNGVPLIKDIEIGLKKGEILTLIGPNGAGKTTIIRSMIRQLKPVAGVVYLEQTPIGEVPPHDLSKRLSVVLTERIRPEMMTCRDVVATGRYPYTGRFGILGEDDNRIVDESMELVDIAFLKDRDFMETSDGQKQRVMLARAICQQPDIIVLDEPTSFLDIRYKLEFLSIIQNMSRKRGLSVIMSLHELDLAGRISDKIACVRGDKLDRFGTPEEIFKDGYIRELYGISVGSYHERSGDLELDKITGEPKIFVIAGDGSGTETFRRLQREQTPFATGILWENDIDYSAALSLAAEVVSVKAFSPITEEESRRARDLIDRCDRVICTLDLDQMGSLGTPLKELCHYAENCGKLVNK